MNEKRKKKILAIDNDKSVCSMIVQTLESIGFDVSDAASPEEAVEKAREIEPDLVFCSLLLQGSNGLKVSKLIHSIKSLKKVPFIMLISYPGELDPRYTVTIGIVDVLVKPLNADEIVSKTQNVLGKDTVPEEDIVEIEEDHEIAEGIEQRVEGEELVAESLEPQEMVLEHEAESIEQDAEGEEDKELDEESIEEDWQESSTDKKEHPTKKIILVFVTVLIILGLSIGAFKIKELFRQDTSKEMPGPRLKEIPVKKKPVLKETITDRLPIGDSKTKGVVPLVSIDKPKAVSTKPLSPRKAKASKKRTYSVQVGAFKNDKNAILFADKLKQKGYDVFIQHDLWANNKMIHRVMIGKFDESQKALEQSRVILEKEGIKSIIYRD